VTTDCQGRYAAPSVPWCEYVVGTAPGVPLGEGWALPGMALPRDGWLVPSDAPGFGLDIPREWLTPFDAAYWYNATYV